MARKPAARALEHEFVWEASVNPRTSASASRGALRLSVLGRDVWTADRGFRWTWIELLEWLATNWERLEIEDGLPFEIDPIDIQDLLNHVRRRAAANSEPLAERDELRLWDFLETHDLNRSLQGADDTGIILWREGMVGHVLTEQSHDIVDWRAIRSDLTALGESIANRLRLLGEVDDRGRAALEAWRTRRDRPAERVFEVATGLPRARLFEIRQEIHSRNLDAWSPDPAAPEFDEVLVAARMTAALPNAAVMDVLAGIVTIPSTQTAELDAMSHKTVAFLSELTALRPYEQGYEVALQFRPPGLTTSFNCRAWTERMSVSYREMTLESSLIDAFAVWGPRHGPSIVVNRRGRHAASLAGRNASVAHEIGHLLMDREGALPAAEVLGGRVNRNVEARARAFAAELLLPRALAGEEMRSATSSRDAAARCRSLARRFVVSAEIVAWQARNSGVILPRATFDYLRAQVTEPWRF